MSKEVAKTTGGAVAIKKYDIQDPKAMTNMAKVLKTHIVKHNLFTNIKGKNYVEVEGWQFAGGMMGIIPKVREVKDLGDGEKHYKWMAIVDLIRISDDQVVATGVAICSNKEKIKSSFDDYAILSMAQTRAIGKAYRTCISWVMKVAGYEGTEAEAMPAQDNPNQDSEEDMNQDKLDQALSKVARMKSPTVLDKTLENLKTNKEYDEDQKKEITKAINKRKKEVAG